MSASLVLTPDYFKKFGSGLFSVLEKNQVLTLNLIAESTAFSRWNDSKLRQLGHVLDGSVAMQLIDHSGDGNRKNESIFTLSGQFELDLELAKSVLVKLKKEVTELPTDPFVKVPKNFGTSIQKAKGNLLSNEDRVPVLAELLKSDLLTGIHSSGTMVRANLNSLGQDHWFETDQEQFDFSMIRTDSDHKSRAVKIDWAGQNWSKDQIESEIQQAKVKMELLLKPKKKILPGQYRTYLAPAAVAEFFSLISGIFGTSVIRKGGSPVRHLQEGRTLHPGIQLAEDFSLGRVPKFNSDGEVSFDRIQILENGILKNQLVSSASALEFGVQSNAAVEGELLRSPVLLGGSLREDQILDQLGEGLYLSNLHYLNWSDFSEGRVTGMTRYACFWVENGKLVQPIEDLRWDDSLFHFLGEKVEAITEKSKLIPNNSTYEYRQLGGCQVPGILLKSMKYVL